MNVPYSWLKELVSDVPNALTTADLLTGIGLSVERVYDLPAPPRGVVVARVEAVSEIGDSEHLLKASVSDGKQQYSVVTGAPNTETGMLTALAKPGTTLPATGLTVERREMAGVLSEGVLCSPRELGLYDYGGGLLVFGDDVEPGLELAEVWPAETVIELELTPNRADAFSLLGVARDLAAKLGTPFKHPALAEKLDLGDRSVSNGLKVISEDEACPRFTLRLIEGVSVKPSPIWLQRRLAALGLRPRNNLVDVTNFVTFELGQPSHTYDRDCLQDGTIVVRRAQQGERMTALNEEVLEFTEDDLLITTPIPPNPPYEGGNKRGDLDSKPVGLAGVIGGLDDSVSKTTRAVALEVAWFEPVTVRKAAKRHSLSTDASYRFERGVDPNLQPLANARVAQLLVQVSGGKLHPGLTELGDDRALRHIPFRPSRVEFLMALKVPIPEQKRYLEALGCEVEVRAEDDWLITAPSWRFDLAIEEDIIEEVARLHGYDDIPSTLPAMYFIPKDTDSTHRSFKSALAGMGFQETINYVFSSDEELKRAAAPEASVRLQSPPNVERSVLRTALYPGLLNAAQLNHTVADLALFEIGRVFRDQETERLGLLVRGKWLGGVWREDKPLDFFLFKGLCEKLAETVGAELKLEPKAFSHLHPGVSAEVFWNGEARGWLGLLHPRIAAAYDLPETYLAELDMPLAGAAMNFSDYERQPFAERDLAVIAPEDVTYAALEDLVQRAAGERLESIAPFDVYTGKPIPEGKRSIALRLHFRHPERALRDDEVDAYMANVISAVSSTGYDIRDR